MGMRLLPQSVSELCAHALQLERECEQRFVEYAKQMKALGAYETARTFEDLAQDGAQEVAVLQAASGARKPAELSPWEYVWRLSYLPEGMESRLVPQSAREALQLAVLAKRRAQMFYDDVADNARDSVVRGCAAEMAIGERVHLKRLQRLLTMEILTEAAARRLAAAGKEEWRV